MWHVNCSFGTDDAICLVLEIALKTSQKVTLGHTEWASNT